MEFNKKDKNKLKVFGLLSTLFMIVDFSFYIYIDIINRYYQYLVIFM